MTGAVDRASALFDAGKYAKAKEVLDGFIAAPPAGAQPQEVQKAQHLLDRVKGVLADQYQAVEAARQRAKAEESKRAPGEGSPPGPREADARRRRPPRPARPIRRSHGASTPRSPADRAADAFSLAMDYYNQGQYDNARTAFEHLQQVHPGPAQGRSPVQVGPRRGARTAHRRIPDETTGRQGQPGPGRPARQGLARRAAGRPERRPAQGPPRVRRSPPGVRQGPVRRSPAAVRGHPQQRRQPRQGKGRATAREAQPDRPAPEGYRNPPRRRRRQHEIRRRVSSTRTTGAAPANSSTRPSWTKICSPRPSARSSPAC